MNRETLKETIGWGVALWFLGFAFGIIFFPFVPVEYIGIPIIILMIPAIIAASLKIFKSKTISFRNAVIIAFSWAVSSIVLDKFILVNGFKAQNFYDFDLIVFYILLFITPILVWKKHKSKTH